MRNVRSREEYAQWQLDRHAESLDGKNPRDFIDAYMIRMQNMIEQKQSTTFHGEFRLRLNMSICNVLLVIEEHHYMRWYIIDSRWMFLSTMATWFHA